MGKIKLYGVALALVVALGTGWFRSAMAAAEARGIATAALTELSIAEDNHATTIRNLNNSRTILTTTKDSLRKLRTELDTSLTLLHASNLRRGEADSALTALLESQLSSTDAGIVITRISGLQEEVKVCTAVLTTCDLQRQNLAEEIVGLDLRLRADSVLQNRQRRTILSLEDLRSTGSSSTLPWAIAIIATALHVLVAVR